MSRFAQLAQAQAGRATRPDTVNASGGEAHAQSPKLALASLVLSSMLQSRSTESPSTDMQRVRSLVQTLAASNDLQFAAKAAVYARKTHGLRSITHVLAGEIANIKGEHPWKGKFFAKMVDRLDDAAEMCAYYIAAFLTDQKKWTLPNAMKRGIAKALLGFNDYHFAKYQGKSKALGLVDVVNLVHPKAPEGHAIHKLMKGTLKAADTWETALSKAGKEDDAEAKKAGEWLRLLKDKQLGYLAALRNVRNIIEQAGPEALTLLCDLLTNEELIAKARIFPFQFNAARSVVMELTGPGPKLALKAINQAMNISCKNVPALDGRTIVVVDGSGSMGGDGPKEAFGIASLFAAIIIKSNPTADLMLFADRSQQHTIDSDNSILGIQAEINRLRVNGGTDFNCIFTNLRAKYDRIIILSDMQAWVGGYTPAAQLKGYMGRHHAKPFIYSFDLTGSGTMQFPEADTKVCALAGWSDKIFDVMAQIEQDPQALINEIDKVEL